MTRFARRNRVFFVEQPILDPAGAGLEARRADKGVIVVTPRLPAKALASPAVRREELAALLDQLFADHRIDGHVAWYDTPMALPESAHLRPRLVVYDCIEELSAGKGAPPEIGMHEAELFARADLVFTSGQRLYEAKSLRHPHVFCFPGSVDVVHFAHARAPLPPPIDQADIPRPRLGYAGVIDERVDLTLIAGIAAAAPAWEIVLVGPVVKIEAAALPKADNIHYLGLKTYDQLPHYLAGWDVALLPLARNAVAHLVSPNKTAEYLAAGRPVVSTSLRDVVRPYGSLGLAAIADEVPDFVAAIKGALASDLSALRARADAYLAKTSWEMTVRRMLAVMAETSPVRDNRGGGLATTVIQ